MRYSAKRKQDISVSPAPIEIAIPLLDPVRIYTAKELAAMPLSKMNEAIAAQEKYYILEHTTKMGGAGNTNTPCHAKWCLVNSGSGKVTYSLQDQQRVHSATHCSSIGNAWIGEVERGC